MTDSEATTDFPREGESEIEMIKYKGGGTDTENDIENPHTSSSESKYTDDEDGDEGSEQTGAAELAWKDLQVTSPDGKTTLLKDAIGSVKGRFLAIMGPSGAGKTSMMNVLACRLQKSKAKGKRVLDGHKYDRGVLKRLAGYVMQDDLLFPDLTVKETLKYAAFLRMPANISRREKKKRVKEVIQQLGLEKCKDTKVGNSLKKGISGGERKRLCVGIELLLKPRLLFLDEPTSGLDGVTALTLCRILRDLAHNNNCTVVCTIHQPASQIFNLFDDLMVLKSGRIVYHGAADTVLDFYADAGFPCPPHTNPADHILDVISPAAFTHEEIDKADQNAEKLISMWKPPAALPVPDKPKKGKKYFKKTFAPRVSWWTQVWYLTARAYKNIYRERLVLFSQLVQCLFMAVLIGTVFLQIGDTQKSITKRQPVLFFVCINQGIFGALILINSFPAERLIVLRERQGGAYHASAYYMAKTIAEMSVQLIFPFLFSCIVYWLIGLQADAGKFFIFIIFMELCSLAATSLALMVSAICKTVTMSVTVLPLVIEVARLFGGFFLSPADLPNYFAWLDALSFVKYSYVGIALNELTGLELTCTQSELNSSGQCPITRGEQTIETLGLDYITVWGCALVLCAMIIVTRIFAFLAFRFLKG